MLGNYNEKIKIFNEEIDEVDRDLECDNTRPVGTPAQLPWTGTDAYVKRTPYCTNQYANLYIPEWSFFRGSASKVKKLKYLNY